MAASGAGRSAPATGPPGFVRHGALCTPGTSNTSAERSAANKGGGRYFVFPCFLKTPFLLRPSLRLRQTVNEKRPPNMAVKAAVKYIHRAATTLW